MSFKVNLAHEKAIKPRKQHREDAGYDLFSIDRVLIAPWKQEIIDTGVDLVELPNPFMLYSDDWVSGMFIWSRSGMDSKLALHTGAGVIDCLYRGRILVLLKNQSDEWIDIPYGKAIAQAIISPVYIGDVEVVAESAETDRGATGGITQTHERGGSMAFVYRGKTE